jgi:hypothetical protein
MVGTKLTRFFSDCQRRATVCIFFTTLMTRMESGEKVNSDPELKG